ncbi:hypothetical protein [Aeromicrobium fastidiosum]|uniref:hypothetical protein n=1 Tax=Aeromicrobium fastidiosum TaxID=52699 RepID=UPI00165F5580|nr:hypothetical protein [Aeromicrobium fastidiosum]MBP2390017.1 hypothetical protein [Aeromicrobium fastidiosum]
MRTSILSRSVIAVATLAIGSVALVAAPATAATPSGITRQQVLSAADAGRSINSYEDYLAASEQMRAIAAPTCKIAADDQVDVGFRSASAGKNADGVIIQAFISAGDSERAPSRQCVVAAIASADPSLTLSGKLTLTGTSDADVPTLRGVPNEVTTTLNADLSGDVFVSAALPVADASRQIYNASFTATGNTTRSDKVLTIDKVADTKSKASKRFAKKKYVQRLKAAKKAYAKAVKQAGGNASAKAAARSAYSARRAAAGSRYAYAIADYKLTKTRTTQTIDRPFSIGAEVQYD